MSHRAGAPGLPGDASQANAFGRRRRAIIILREIVEGATVSHRAGAPVPHPRPFSRREKGGKCFLSPCGREVRSEGTGINSKANGFGRHRPGRWLLPDTVGGADMSFSYVTVSR